MASWALSLVLLSLVGLSLSQPYPLLLNIEGIPTSSLFYPLELNLQNPTQIPTSAFGLGRPLDPPLLPPVSQRTIYKAFNPYRLTNIPVVPTYTSPTISNFGSTVTQNVAGLPVGVQRNEVILLRFAAPITQFPPPVLILQQPNLDVDPYSCGGVTGQLGACRCLNKPDYTPVPIQCNFALTAPTPDPTLVWCQVPTATYFPYAPLPGENPFHRSYRRICLQSAQGTAVPLQPQLLDTQLWYSVTTGCVDSRAPDADVIDPALLLRCDLPDPAVVGKVVAYPGIVSAPPAGGFTFASPVTSPYSVTLGPFLENSPGNNFAGQRIPTQFIQNGEAFNGETPSQRSSRLARTTCCGYRIEAGVADLGVCIDPSQGTGCCGTKPYDLSVDQCCTRTSARVRAPATGSSIFDARTNLALINLQEFFPQVPVIRFISQTCPCNNANQQVVNGVLVNTDCASFGANVNNFGVADNTGLTTAFIPRLQCCVSTRFPEYPNSIITTVGGVDTTVFIPKLGHCYDPLQQIFTWLCCDDGNVYDADQQQCCRVTGVQSVGEGCPCEADADCVNPVLGTGANQFRCCRQRFPSIRLQNEFPAVSCSPYANFPTPSTLQQATQNFVLPVGGVFPPNSGGNAVNAIQRCGGRCVDTTWQICCNGVVCVNEYERCCNDTCCNRHSQTCVDGYRPGSLTSRFNQLNFRVEFEICSTIEAMNGRRAFNIFIVPVFLLFATVASLALIITFVRRAVEHVFELTERAIVFLAAFSVLIATVYFFSPMYKFGITIIWINLALIAIAAIRTIRPAILAVILQFLLILYIIDPFPANHWFGMSHGATGENEFADHDDLPSSLFETAYYWWRDRGVRCTRHYDYFNFDFNARDTLRWHNPQVRTFGYCSREWISVLMIFAGFLIITELLLLLLVIYSLVKLLGFKPEEVVQLEVRAEPMY